MRTEWSCEVYRSRYRASNSCGPTALLRNERRWLRKQRGVEQTRRLREAAHQVRALHRLTARALAEIVERREQDPGVVARIGDERDVAEVGTAHRLERRRLALGQHAYERLAVVGVVQREPRALRVAAARAYVHARREAARG